MRASEVEVTNYELLLRSWLVLRKFAVQRVLGRYGKKLLLLLLGFIVVVSVRPEIPELFYLFMTLTSRVTNLAWSRDFELDDFHPNGLTVVGPSVLEARRAKSAELMQKICPEQPPNLLGYIPNLDNLTYIEYDEVNPDLLLIDYKDTKDGHHSPENCHARHKIAIIIPLRNRRAQLKVLLSHIHPILQRQQLDYSIFVITQAGGGLFNRAKLLNIGVSESMKYGNFDCFVFHDVDLLVENDKCLHWCHHKNPRHLARHVDSFYYEPIHYSLYCQPPADYGSELYGFGGVSMLTREQFQAVNGYSNLYWGWGGEDDDMFIRLQHKGYTVVNPYGELCSYKMVKHKHETNNAINPGRHALLYHSASRMDEEGYSSLKYQVVSTKAQSLFINITVDVGKPSARMEELMMTSGTLWRKCASRMPWNRLFMI